MKVARRWILFMAIWFGIKLLHAFALDGVAFFVDELTAVGLALLAAAGYSAYAEHAAVRGQRLRDNLEHRNASMGGAKS
ncbi:MAG: hypothetical protein L6Q99_14455 [Planctomycetes bacterium]|nr:hypothetical protein [Planctomycetota bacterium]